MYRSIKNGYMTPMNDIIGFHQPDNSVKVTDFVNLVLRAKLARRFGIFGRIPMWGGVKLHEFYPPLSTVIVQLLRMKGAVLFYFLLTYLVWAIGKDPVTASLFILSYFHLIPMLYYGRYSEFLGYTFAVSAVFVENSVISGVLLGLAALSYPIPLLFGAIMLMLKLRLDPLLFMTTVIVCGWWYIPYVLKRKKLSYLEEGRPDKFFGIYLSSYYGMVNIAFFLFLPSVISVLGVLVWLLPVSLKDYRSKPGFSIRRGFHRLRFYAETFKRPFSISDVPKILPKIQNIKEATLLVDQNGYAGSFGEWIWTCACYLLDKGHVVYNGLPSTEIPVENLKIPSNIRSYKVDELKV